MRLRETRLGSCNHHTLTASHLIPTCIFKTMAVLLPVKMLLPGCRSTSYLCQAENLWIKTHLGPNILPRVKREGHSWQWSDLWTDGSFLRSCVLLKLKRGRNTQKNILSQNMVWFLFKRQFCPCMLVIKAWMNYVVSSHRGKGCSL